MAKKEIKSFADAVASINALNKDWDILSFGDPSKNLKKLKLYSMCFDLSFMGGLPYGELATISGVEHSGKSSVAACLMARYQRENPNKVCVWVDAERTLETQGSYFQDEYGLSFDKKNFLKMDTTGLAAEEIFTFILKLQEFDEIGMIVLDSSRALITKADLDSDFGKDNGQRASVAKVMGKFVKQMIQYLPKKQNILLIINQLDITKEMFSTSYSESGGYSLRFFPSIKIRLGTRKFTKEGSITEISASDAQKAENVDKVDGMKLHYVTTKSRVGKLSNAGGYITIKFGKGLDVVNDFLSVTETAGILVHPSPRTTVITDFDTGEVLLDAETKSPLQFSKQADLVNYLETHEKLFREIYQKALDKLCGAKKHYNLIDQGIIDEQMAIEAALANDVHTEAEALAKDGIDPNEIDTPNEE